MQVHCQGWWQVPWTHPGIRTQSSHRGPPHPGSHLPHGAKSELTLHTMFIVPLICLHSSSVVSKHKLAQVKYTLPTRHLKVTYILPSWIDSLAVTVFSTFSVAKFTRAVTGWGRWRCFYQGKWNCEEKHTCLLHIFCFYCAAVFLLLAKIITNVFCLLKLCWNIRFKNKLKQQLEMFPWQLIKILYNKCKLKCQTKPEIKII